MNAKETEQRIDEILLKKTRGEKLTDLEQRILAYGYYAARCTCGLYKDCSRPNLD